MTHFQRISTVKGHLSHQCRYYPDLICAPYSWRKMESFTRKGFPGGSDDKESACNAGDPGSIPGLGRCPGERQGNPLQYSCLENSTVRGAWWATGHGVAKSQTRLSYEHIQHVQGINLFVFLFFCHLDYILKVHKVTKLEQASGFIFFT